MRQIVALALNPYDITGFSALVSVYGKACLVGVVLLKVQNETMGADKLTHRALLWHPATALQFLKSTGIYRSIKTREILDGHTGRI